MMGPNFRQWELNPLIIKLIYLFTLEKKNHRSGESLLKEYKASAATFLTE